MTLNLAIARRKANEYINKMGAIPCSIVESKIREDIEGWYFPYQSMECLLTGDLNKSLVGNWPIFVSRDGSYVEPRRPSLLAK